MAIATQFLKHDILQKTSIHFVELSHNLLVLILQNKASDEYKYSPKHYHSSSSSLSKYQVKRAATSNSTSLLAPPKQNNERRHSLGGKLAAALHL
jgi:hypothetical protein